MWLLARFPLLLGGVRQGIKIAISRGKSLDDIVRQSNRLAEELRKQRLKVYDRKDLSRGEKNKREYDLFKREAQVNSASDDYIKNIKYSRQYQKDNDDFTKGFLIGDQRRALKAFSNLNERKYDKSIYGKRKKRKS